MAEEQSVPVIVASVNPFRLVKRHASDVFASTYEEINSGTYNYVKLSRMSTYLDVGLPKPFSMAISFDGSFIVPALPEFRNLDVAVDLFNNVLGKLLLGGVYFEAVSPNDIGRGQLYFNGYFSSWDGRGPTAKFHSQMRSKFLSIVDLPILLKPPSLLAEDLHKAFAEGSSVAEKIPTLSLPILVRGVTHLINHEWAESLINLWSNVEQVIAHIWAKYIVLPISAEGKIPGRIDALKDHRSWTASTQIELLSQRKFIDTETQRLLSIARKVRNDFVHNATNPTKEQTQAAAEGLFRLISRTITDFKRVSSLKGLLNVYKSHDKLETDLNASRKKIGAVEAWLAIPPIPGSVGWGDKPYETFDDIQLKIIEEPSNPASTSREKRQ